MTELSVRQTAGGTRLNFFPLPQGQGSLRLVVIINITRRVLVVSSSNVELWDAARVFKREIADLHARSCIFQSVTSKPTQSEPGFERSLTDELNDDRARRFLPKVGLGLTVAYLSGLVVYLWSQGQNPADLRLNELGDFIGGISSPLAFFWLVLGFLQQGREIRLSSKALHLQAREMRASWEEGRKTIEQAIKGSDAADRGSQ